VAKELVNIVRAAAWRSPAEAAALVQATVDVDAADLLGILELLSHKMLAQDTERHAMRRQVFFALVHRRPDETLFKPFVKALRTAAPDVRQVLVDVLPKVNAVADHLELVELLRAPETEVRAAAARVLVDIGSKTAVQALSSMLFERGFAGLREGLDVVMRTSGAQALPVLEKLLARPDATERLLAIRWLGDAQHMSRSTGAALRLLVPLLKDGHESIGIAAAIAVGQIASENDYHALLVPLTDGKNLKLAGTVIEGLKRFPTERTAELLERKLASGPNVLRLAALSCVENAVALQAVAAAAAALTGAVAPDIDPLIGVAVSALGHSQIVVRNRAAEVMATLSKSQGVELGRTIVWLLRSGDVTTRRMAAEVLRSVKDPHGELWPKLVSSLRDDDWWVRERVMDALVDLAGHGLSRYMVAWLQDRSDVVRRFALNVLLRLKDKDTIAAVVHTARTDPDWWAREKAVEVIAEFKDARAVPILIDLMQTPELQMACIAALKILDPSSAANHLLPLVASPDADVRLLVLKFIEEQNDPAHEPLVEPMKRDPDPAVQRLAHGLLVRWRITKNDRSEANVPAPVSLAASVTDDRPLDKLLLRMVELDGSDLIIAPERPVFMKRQGNIEPLTDGPLSTERVASLLTPLVTAAMAVKIDQKKDVDFSTVVKATGHRFRVNLFRQRGGLSGVFRAIRVKIPVLEELGLPPLVRELTSVKTGLVLVGGATSSGKSTTLAAMIDYINRTQPRHVVSLEDPIEIVHSHKLALVQQREVGSHTKTFARALRSALRQDPDVIVIGEMRDKETIELALTAAETGHLVVGTLHTTSSDGCVERIINAFGKNQQDQARASLADSLRAVVCQTLVRRKLNSPGPRMLASELLVNNDAVANLIRKAKTNQIPSIVATSRETGMQSLDQDLIRLARTGVVDEIDVLARARNKAAVEQALSETPSQTGKITIPRKASG
jgi:twitching motility protein PilT